MANRFIWETVGAEPYEMKSNDYRNMLEFWKGMNAFRQSSYGELFRVDQPMPEDYYTWITPEELSSLGYIVNNQILVLLNAGNKDFTFSNINLPAGNWKQIASNQEVNHIKGVKSKGQKNTLKGGKSTSFTLQSQGLAIWVNTGTERP